MDSEQAAGPKKIMAGGIVLGDEDEDEEDDEDFDA